MEDDLLGDSSNIKKQGSGKPDYSLGIDGVIHVSCLNRVFQALGGEFVFSNESPIDARDTCPMIYIQGLGC